MSIGIAVPYIQIICLDSYLILFQLLELVLSS